jgi:hypothetical protein
MNNGALYANPECRIVAVKRYPLVRHSPAGMSDLRVPGMKAGHAPGECG